MPRIYLFSFFSLILLNVKGQDPDQRTIVFTPGSYTLKETLRIAEMQGIDFAYSSNLLPDTYCSFSKDTMSVSALLDKLELFGVKHTFASNQIILSYQPSLAIPVNRSFRGIIVDRETGEVMIGATVQEVNSQWGAVTNKYGYFSLTLKRGIHLIRVSFMGYEDLIDTITLADRDLTINFQLKAKPRELGAVEISAIAPDLNVTSLTPGISTLNLNTKGQIPYFLGEVDVLQGAVLLPGISTLGEDANGLNVRGGSADQNLILLDEATVYHPHHLYGLISIFNPEMVNNIEIMKGFIPPSYGGRASSVVTVHQKEGNDQEYHLTGGIGLVSARFIVEGPLKRGASSFIASGRQSLLNLSLDESNTSSNFQDLNVKMNWKADRNNRFLLSGYIGNDRNKNRFDMIRNWGNRNLTARWNHLFGHRMFGNFSAIVSEFNYKVSQPQEAASYIGKSRIVDYNLKSDFGFIMSPRHELNFGSSVIWHRLKPGDRIPFKENASSSQPLILDTENGLESALYLSHKATLSDHLSVLYGLRISSLHNLGSGRVFRYQDGVPRADDKIIDTTWYKTGETIKAFFGWEPRASLVYKFTESNSIKASYSKTYQYLHLISNTVSPSPTDIWKLSDTYIPPVASGHYSLGYYHNFKNNQYEAYVEGYYKRLEDILEYKDGADLLFNENVETELLNGTGRSYGLEFFVSKNTGKLTGWLSYTLSSSENRVPGVYEGQSINGGNYFPTNHDRKHDISLVGIYEILPRLSGSLSFNFNSGRPYTLPNGKYKFEGITIPDFGFRNQSRLPDYHRLDLSLKLQGKKVKKNGEQRSIEDYWTLVVYNVYGRKNVHSYFYDESADGVTRVIPNTIFDQVIPAITYHFRF